MSSCKGWATALVLSLGALLNVALSGGAAAAETAQARPAIRSFDLHTIETLGASIYRQDAAAWRATDALVKRVPSPRSEKIIGWLVEGTDALPRVRFLRDLGQGPEAAYDIDVPLSGEPTVNPVSDRALSADELTAWKARQTAIHSLKEVCRPGYNTAVLKEPGGAGWLVWLLAPSPASGVIPVGGHYRVSVSADGSTVTQSDRLFASCLTLDPRQGLPAGAKTLALTVSHVVSPTPVETHVFLQLLYRLPMVVIAGDRIWEIDHGRITERVDIKGATPPPSPRPAAPGAG